MAKIYFYLKNKRQIWVLCQEIGRWKMISEVHINAILIVQLHIKKPQRKKGADSTKKPMWLLSSASGGTQRKSKHHLPFWLA